MDIATTLAAVSVVPVLIALYQQCYGWFRRRVVDRWLDEHADRMAFATRLEQYGEIDRAQRVRRGADQNLSLRLTVQDRSQELLARRPVLSLSAMLVCFTVLSAYVVALLFVMLGRGSQLSWWLAGSSAAVLLVCASLWSWVTHRRSAILRPAAMRLARLRQARPQQT